MRVLVLDVHASEAGALSILKDLYAQVVDCERAVEWLFVVSTPVFPEREKLRVKNYPWVKKSWIHRLFFDAFVLPSILKEFRPDKVISLQNKGISAFHGEQAVYLHLPFLLCDYEFTLKRDGKRLWAYQHLLRRSFFSSLKKADRVVVQTDWMRRALADQAGVSTDRIVVVSPQITELPVEEYRDGVEHRRRFFYPATAFSYKNHAVVLEACRLLQERGVSDFSVTFTITKEQAKALRLDGTGLPVTFAGMLEREEVFSRYARSVLLFPSYVESFGLPLLEGRLSACFVLASDCPFSREILDGYENALFFPPQDAEALADRMEEVMGGMAWQRPAPYRAKGQTSLLEEVL